VRLCLIKRIGECGGDMDREVLLCLCFIARLGDMDMDVLLCLCLTASVGESGGVVAEKSGRVI
jgi:hypothetical protein